jgi:hypothetical protein
MKALIFAMLMLLIGCAQPKPIVKTQGIVPAHKLVRHFEKVLLIIVYLQVENGKETVAIERLSADSMEQCMKYLPIAAAKFPDNSVLSCVTLRGSDDV